ncbi:hypothetical protein ACJ73_05228, partial [Blastomyces percursus]
MSGLPTPRSERKRSLRSHSRAVAAGIPPTVEESSSGSEEEEVTQYELAPTDDMDTPEPSGRVDKGKAPERDSSEENTPSPMPTNINMPTPNAAGTITMTTADLLAFCQQMMNTRQNVQNNDNMDARQEIREYQREVQGSMDTKAVTTFDGSNYQAWKIGILADAEVIGGTDILTKNQHSPPGLEGLEKERWNVRTKALYR